MARVPRTILRNIINRRRLPATEEQLGIFLTLCHIRRSDRAHIHAAWHRIRAFPQSTPPTHRPHRPRVARTTGLDHPRIGTGYRGLLDHLSPDEVETALTFGVALVAADKAHRDGMAPPPSLEAIMPVAHLLSVAARQHPNPTGTNWLSSVLADAIRRTPSRSRGAVPPSDGIRPARGFQSPNCQPVVGNHLEAAALAGFRELLLAQRRPGRV
ncbi:hypothetical protein [Streptomyces niveus]|uniref:hypothetical protein n=1 Tax=Streptomyces niveus TaxID=193462 RepID=UPI00342D67A3